MFGKNSNVEDEDIETQHPTNITNNNVTGVTTHNVKAGLSKDELGTDLKQDVVKVTTSNIITNLLDLIVYYKSKLVRIQEIKITRRSSKSLEKLDRLYEKVNALLRDKEQMRHQDTCRVLLNLYFEKCEGIFFKGSRNPSYSLTELDEINIIIYEGKK